MLHILKNIFVLLLATLFISCSVSHVLSRKNASASLRHARRTIDTTLSYFQRPLKVTHRGDSVYLVETGKIDGENIGTLKVETVKVVANVKNVAERNGEVNIGFNIILPKSILGSDRMVILYPILHKTNDSLVFKPVCLRGSSMDILQQREGWQMNLYMQRFKGSAEKTYNKFMRFQTPLDTRLDSVINRANDITYYYHKTLPSSIISKRMSLTISGEVRSIDGSTYRIPPKDTIGFLVSSMLSFIDERIRYKTMIVDKYVKISRRYNINFEAGSFSVLESDEELKKLKNATFDDEYEIDSICLTASSSPEGLYKVNKVLSEKRAKSISGFINPSRIETIAENWNQLRDSIRISKLVHKSDILKLIDSVQDPDQREELIKARYRKEYQFIKTNYYPSLRYLSALYYLRRKGMEKDTIHLHVIDSTYLNAVSILKQRSYLQALEILSPYKDRNTAIALMSLNFNREAKKIILKETQSDQREYLLAILCSRLGETEEGRRHYLNACKLNDRMEFRGNLDPEINKLLQK